MRTDRATGRLLEVPDCLHVKRLCGLGVNVEDEDLAALQPRQPELPPVVGETTVMRFMPSTTNSKSLGAGSSNQ